MIPGWRRTRFDRLATRVRRPVDPDDGVVTAFRDGQVTLRAHRRTEGFTVAFQEAGYQGVKAGDLVVHAMDAFAGAIGVSDSDGKASPVVHAYRTDERANARFLAYCLRDLARSGYILSLAKGIRERSTAFDPATLKYVEFEVPDLPGQTAIADFLDRETAQVDLLLEKQYSLIDRLRERRDATIRYALTHGLSHGVHMRPVDIPLVGEVPAHWKTIPTRHVCRIRTGSEDSGNADPQGRYRFYVRGREILRIDNYAFDGEAVMTPGDGQGGTGKVFHYATGKFQAHQRVYVFNDFRLVLGKYFYHWLSTFLQPIALAGSYTVTMESLRRPLLTSFPVVVPPVEEQAEILNYIEEETAKSTTLIAKAERFIELARERRSALITAAVTGQIDVTEAGEA